jgi:hypothetical protein
MRVFITICCAVWVMAWITLVLGELDTTRRAHAQRLLDYDRCTHWYEYWGDEERPCVRP